MKFNIPILIFLLAVFGKTNAQFLFLEKNKQSAVHNEIVASIGTISISAEEFYYNYEFGPAFPKRQKKSKEVHLNFMINEKLLALEGYKNEMLNKDDIKSIYSDITSDLATEELFRDEILTRVEVSKAEINEVVNNKNTSLEIRWIYAPEENKIKECEDLLIDQTQFDSVFKDQLNDTVFIDQRQMKISMFNLNKKILFLQI